jgi:hypothetical protein
MSSSVVASSADYFLDVFCDCPALAQTTESGSLPILETYHGSALFHTSAKFSILSGNSEA